MRVGVDYRLLASPQNLVNRGIGRFTQQQLRNVLALDRENEYLLLCPPAADVTLILPEIRAATNVCLRFAPEGVDPPASDPYDRRGQLARSGAYQDWVASLDVDLYHATAPFVLEQTAPPAFDACPMVATVYDFIPLIYPDAYLGEPGQRSAYAAAARHVASARRLIAISDGVRDDAAAYLGFPRRSIDRASPFADGCFAPLEPQVVASTLRRLESAVGLPPQFVLSVAALHYSKNLTLLLDAYSRLSPSFRRSLPLVLACHLGGGGEAHVRKSAAEVGFDEGLVLTGYVSDAELAALYNRATLVVHPSRHEGFGLPVVEAMQCGAPVVTTTAPALPEVTAGAAVLVDPDDPTGLAAAIVGLSRDTDRRRSMGEMGKTRAAAFTPEALARSTLDSYRRTVAAEHEERGRPRLAVCTPYRPHADEAAAHAGELIAALAALGDVDVFTDDSHGPLPDDLLDAAAVHHVSAIDRVASAHPFAAVVANVDGDTELPFFDEPAVVVAAAGMRPELVGDIPRPATVVPAPIAGRDPWEGRPLVEGALARSRLGWPADRIVALVLGACDLSFVQPAGVDVVLAPETSSADERVVACDVVVDLAPVPRASVLVGAAAAGKPLLVTAAVDARWPPSFCTRVPSVEGALREVTALAANPEERRRRGAAARVWFDGEASGTNLLTAYRVGLGFPMPEQDPPCRLNRLLDADDCGPGRSPGEWAVSMSMEALARFGMLQGDARLLFLGAAAAQAGLRASADVADVTVAGPWLDPASPPWCRALLVDPGLVAGRPVDASRGVVQHADPRRLPFADGAFDAAVSCRAGEALTTDAMEQAMAETARVVRRGGLITVSALVRLHGPPTAPGIPLEWVRDHLLVRSGLVPVDQLCTSVSEVTAGSRRAFAAAVDPAAPVPTDRPLAVARGALLGTLHLALRKPDG